jgi:Protein involved in catabolism of external DNA
MNYRHAFHAGNFADVMKHALLARLIDYLLKKDKPFRVIDTHAGIGLYALDGDEATRTGEWQEGIARLETPLSPEVETVLAPYREVIGKISERHGPMVYPGSPAIVREMLRRQDRAIFVELHPADAELLSERFNTVSNIKVMHLDGWTALHALIPPKENRGLILIDPPFEKLNELEKMGDELLKALTKWRTGIYAAWYPIKDKGAIDRWAKVLDQSLDRPALRLELLIDDPRDVTRLNGCGLMVINPPWTLQEEARTLLSALAERLGWGGKGSYTCQPLGSPP